METAHHRVLRRVAAGFLTGPSGRLTAFVVDVGVVAARYWRGRLAGEEAPW